VRQFIKKGSGKAKPV